MGNLGCVLGVCIQCHMCLYVVCLFVAVMSNRHILSSRTLSSQGAAHDHKVQTHVEHCVHPQRGHEHCVVGGEGSKERYAYILAPQQMSPGDIIQSGPDAGIKTGNSLPLSAIPVGTALHNVEMHPGRGGQLARSAGTAARLVTKGVCSSTDRQGSAMQATSMHAKGSLHV